MPRRTSIVLRLSGLILIAAGLLMLLAMTSTDFFTGIKQKQLAQQWNRMVNSGRAPGKVPAGFGAIPPAVLKESPGTPFKLKAPYPCPDKFAELLKRHDERIAAQKPVAGGQRLYKAGTTSTTEASVPVKHSLAHKSPFARIVIPRIKLDAIVVEGVDQEALNLGPGHMEETAWPGETGNMVISGHRVTHSHPFYYLDELKKGDPITISTKNGDFTYYVVRADVVAPTAVGVTKPSPDQRLTLTTCNPRFSARTRLIITAKLHPTPRDYDY